MAEIHFKSKKGELTVFLNGRIDARNAEELREKVAAARRGETSAVLDCSGVEYISSAGLRLILQLKKELGNVRLIRVSPEVYDVLRLTGFTDIMSIQVGYRTVKLAECEALGGELYRLDAENAVRVYTGEDALERLEKERAAALAAGDPARIPHETVRFVEGGYGAVYDL